MEPANIQIYDALMRLKRKAQQFPYERHNENLLMETNKYERLLELLEEGYRDFLIDERIEVDSPPYAYQTRMDNGIVIVVIVYGTN